MSPCASTCAAAAKAKASAGAICLEQVADTKSAFDFLAQTDYADAQRIAVFGHSFGAAVAVYAAGTDARIAACISSGGWGHGGKKFRRQHASPEAWQRFSAMMEEGRSRRERGERMMVPRYDIVPIRPGCVGTESCVSPARSWRDTCRISLPLHSGHSRAAVRAGGAMIGRLAGKVALVFGAGSSACRGNGGKATAVLFAREGYCGRGRHRPRCGCSDRTHYRGARRRRGSAGCRCDTLKAARRRGLHRDALRPHRLLPTMSA